MSSASIYGMFLMVVKKLLVLATLCLIGCPSGHLIESTECALLDLSAFMSSDLKSQEAKCKAAQGLAGDNLICVDFDKVTGVSDPKLSGWDFNANTAGCWEIQGGALQVRDFGNFKMSCGLTIIPLNFNQPDRTKYQRATLSLVHRLDLSAIDGQKAQVFIDFDDEASRLIHQTTGRPALAALTTTTLTVNKTEVTGPLMLIYKFFLKVSAGNVSSGRPGWQIQSIAVNATE